MQFSFIHLRVKYDFHYQLYNFQIKKLYLQIVFKDQKICSQKIEYNRIEFVFGWLWCNIYKTMNSMKQSQAEKKKKKKKIEPDQESQLIVEYRER